MAWYQLGSVAVRGNCSVEFPFGCLSRLSPHVRKLFEQRLRELLWQLRTDDVHGLRQLLFHDRRHHVNLERIAVLAWPKRRYAHRCDAASSRENHFPYGESKTAPRLRRRELS